MAPKKGNPVSQADLETIMAKLSILDSLTEKIQALESLPRKIDSLEKLLQESNAKVVALQAEINAKDKIITDFKNKTRSNTIASGV
jgi:prefoldin subunit 5